MSGFETGPVELYARQSWNFDLRIYRDAIVLDLAGATEADVQGAEAACRSRSGLADEWNYFAAVVRQSVADRFIAQRGERFNASGLVPSGQRLVSNATGKPMKVWSPSETGSARPTESEAT